MGAGWGEILARFPPAGLYDGLIGKAGASDARHRRRTIHAFLSAMSEPTLQSLTQLGHAAAIPESPESAVLEAVANPHPGTVYLVRFAVPEFTSLCPITGQPDFAHLVIDYVPDRLLVESKSLKLYLGSFRNHGAFHEDCTIGIAKRLVQVLTPQWLRIGGYWYPRGGIPIDVFWQTGTPPAGLWLPDQGVSGYRGRG